MAKSRLALLAFALAVHGGSRAQEPLAAEEAIDNQKRQLREATGTAPCPVGGESEEIVVCGRRGPDPYRVPFPDEQPPGARAPGLGTARDAMNAGSSPCSTVGRNQRCSGGLPVIQAAMILFKIGKHIVEPDD
jgi:hypothetical protein